MDNLDSEMFGNSVEYHQDDKEIYTLRELANQYTVKSDFTAQAQKQNSQLTDVHGDIRHLERTGCRFKKTVSVHGDIRHLEISTIPRELIL